MQKEVVVGVVTYNRSRLLKVLIEALIAQDYPIKKIIVVDNASGVETQEYMADVTRRHGDTIIWEKLPENVGGAAGFNLAFKSALNESCDYLWIMDDDAEPTVDCLRNLITSSEAEGTETVTCPLVIGDLGPQLYHHKKFAGKWMKEGSVIKPEPNTLVQLDANCFVGPLFPRSVVERIGLPRDDFFIWYDDTEYTYRVSREFNIVLVTNAVIKHHDSNTSNAMDISVFWKQYYGLRNRILVWKQFEIPPIVIWVRVFNFFFVMCARILLKRRDHKFKRLNMLVSAMYHGFTGRSGKAIDPTEWKMGI